MNGYELSLLTVFYLFSFVFSIWILNTNMIPLAASLPAISLALYLYHVNRGMSYVPDEALKFSPHRWTVNEIKEAYERNIDSPVRTTQYLPPKQNRRYIVVGGSGKLFL